MEDGDVAERKWKLLDAKSADSVIGERARNSRKMKNRDSWTFWCGW